MHHPTLVQTINNEVVQTGLDLAKVARASLVIIHSNSQVVIGYINEDYEAKEEWMKKYLSLVKRLTNQNFAAEFVWVPREEKEHVDRLAKAASFEHITIASPLTLRMGCFRRITMCLEGWKFDHHAMCWWERFLPTIPKMFDFRWSRLHHEGIPWRGVWKPFEGVIIGP